MMRLISAAILLCKICCGISGYIYNYPSGFNNYLMYGHPHSSDTVSLNSGQSGPPITSRSSYKYGYPYNFNTYGYYDYPDYYQISPETLYINPGKTASQIAYKSGYNHGYPQAYFNTYQNGVYDYPNNYQISPDISYIDPGNSGSQIIYKSGYNHGFPQAYFNTYQNGVYDYPNNYQISSEKNADNSGKTRSRTIFTSGYNYGYPHDYFNVYKNYEDDHPIHYESSYNHGKPFSYYYTYPTVYYSYPNSYQASYNIGNPNSDTKGEVEITVNGGGKPEDSGSEYNMGNNVNNYDGYNLPYPSYNYDNDKESFLQTNKENSENNNKLSGGCQKGCNFGDYDDENGNQKGDLSGITSLDGLFKILGNSKGTAGSEILPISGLNLNKEPNINLFFIINECKNGRFDVEGSLGRDHMDVNGNTGFLGNFDNGVTGRLSDNNGQRNNDDASSNIQLFINEGNNNKKIGDQSNLKE